MEVIILVIMKLLPVTFYLKGDLSLRGLHDNQEKISSPQISFVLWMLNLPDCGIWKVRYSQHLDDLFLCFHSEPIHGFKHCLRVFYPLSVGLCWPWCWDWAAAAWDAVRSPYWRHFLKEAKKVVSSFYSPSVGDGSWSPLRNPSLTESPHELKSHFKKDCSICPHCLSAMLSFFLNSIFLKLMQRCLSKSGPKGQDKQQVKHTNR